MVLYFVVVGLSCHLQLLANIASRLWNLLRCQLPLRWSRTPRAAPPPREGPPPPGPFPIPGGRSPRAAPLSPTFETSPAATQKDPPLPSQEEIPYSYCVPRVARSPPQDPCLRGSVSDLEPISPLSPSGSASPRTRHKAYAVARALRPLVRPSRQPLPGATPSRDPLRGGYLLRKRGERRRQRFYSP